MSQIDAERLTVLPSSAEPCGNPCGNQAGAGVAMARGRHLLTARTVSTLKEPGRYSDGDGLYLLIRDRGNGIERLWTFRYKRGARGETREKTLSLGPARDVTLLTAREIAGRCRSLLADGKDPRDALVAVGRIPTFEEMADDLIAALEPSFTNPKHRAQWRMTLGEAYCGRIRSKPVNEVSTEDVLAILKPAWLSKPETASRVRGRIERVLDMARVLRHREGENPARWRGHLDHLLPLFELQMGVKPRWALETRSSISRSCRV